MNHFERFLESSVGWREELALAMRQADSLERSAATRSKAAKRSRTAGRRGPPRISPRTLELLVSAVPRMSPACKEMVWDLVAAYERKSRAETFEVLAAAYGKIDQGMDLLMPGCVANLDAFVKHGKVLVGHDPDLWIGDVVSARQSRKGLHVVGRWRRTPMARAIRADVKSRLASHRPAGASIGYDVNECHHEMRDGRCVRVITSLDVGEVSLVAEPMQAFAEFTSA